MNVFAASLQFSAKDGGGAGLLTSVAIKTVKRSENVITRQLGILIMLKQDSLACGNYGIIHRHESTENPDYSC